jgi:glyoxylase-like metal-dependent hydrolase (beta-lactamase superfamily II)
MVNILTLPLGAYQTNCYLVWGENSDCCVVIDPGYMPQNILSQVQKLGKTVSAILLTHGHFDHTGAVNTLADEIGCPVYLHPQDRTLPPELTAGVLCPTCPYPVRLPLAGLTFQVLHTPGHTGGSVCLLAEDCIFSGDTLFQGSCGRTDLGGDWATILQSLQTLKSLPGDYKVYPGHGAATTLEAERTYNPYMR